MAEGDLIQTGIAGLDDILRGGMPKSNVILVEGAAGRTAGRDRLRREGSRLP